MSPLIRKYTPADKQALLHLLRLNTPSSFANEEEADFIHYLENELEYYFVISIADEIVGCGGFNFSGDKTTGKISWDMLHPDFHGKGLGSKLLNYRIEKLKGFEDVEKIIVRTSQLAYTFYEKQGFELQEMQPDYWAKGFDLYRMEYKKQGK